MKEVFKTLEEASSYSISSTGNIYSRHTNKILKPAKDKKGYLRFGLIIDAKLRTRKAHRLVALAFIPNPLNKPQVNHKNGIKHDNRIENLEWVTNHENQMHAQENGLSAVIDDNFRINCRNKYIKKGSEKTQAILDEKKVLEIRAKFKPRVYTRIMLSKEYGVTESCIKDVVIRKSWKHI